MLPPVPSIEDYGISPSRGFLPNEWPLQRLPDAYYDPWEAIISNLQALLLTRRLRGIVEALPVLSTDYLHDEPEWRRAYSVLGFISHAYIWGGDTPIDVSHPAFIVSGDTLTDLPQRLPPCITIPFLTISAHLEVPPVATYAGVCLWNYKPLFTDEPIDNLENLSTLTTFTGSLDESWFYLVSVAIEARCAPIIPTMLAAISAARRNDRKTVRECLEFFAERLDELITLLQRMYENCDPHVFYHRIRPFLAGSKNMADAGLPNGVIYDDGSGEEIYRQYSGGSNAQSSLVQFFDIVLGVEHRPTGEKKKKQNSEDEEGTARPVQNDFLQDMRTYMPGPHRRFLEHVSSVANIHEFVTQNRWDKGLCFAYDASLAMLRALRDKHIQLVSRYIIVKSRESRRNSVSSSTPRAAPAQAVTNIANTTTSTFAAVQRPKDGDSNNNTNNSQKNLKGTGGTALIPFLKQARDETGEPAIEAWARRILGNTTPPLMDLTGKTARATGGRTNGVDKKEVEIVGLAGTWTMDDSEGGLCHW
ncbi:MAG: hypothetical protein M1823_003955 [Watsoniomyces obsoletus]|nr:MAG: hypothetical protein M1823_003955 [Watsoniomyces obsoletus]